MIKRILLLVLVVLVVIQFIRPAENHSDKLSANDITLHYPMPDTVLSILKRSCYDCHSNNTEYPWYNRVQPVAWWLHNHVTEGKRRLNFSEFGSYTVIQQGKKLKSTSSEISEGGMPLNSYLWIHKDAGLDQGQKDLLVHWSDSLQRAIASPK